MSLRTTMLDYLALVMGGTEGLENVRLVRSVRAVDELSTPILQVKTDSFEKLPEAPIRKRIGHFTATLVSPHQDVDKAEDQLDDLLEVLLPALFTFGLSYQDATQVSYGDQYLAYDIRIDTILTITEGD